MTKPKKRNPQDATLRNVRALNKRVLHLETMESIHDKIISALVSRVTKLEKGKGKK